MTEEKNEPRVEARFRLGGFKDTELIMRSNQDTIAEGEDIGRQIAIKIHGTHQIDPKRSLLVLFITVEYIKNYHRDDEETLLSYSNESTFEIENFADVIVLNEGSTYAIPGELLVLFVSVAISTIRGILIVKTANSDLRTVHIPIITNVRELIESWG